MSITYVVLLIACAAGLQPLNTNCPGGPNCWCPWDTAHEYFPPLDEEGKIICDDTGEMSK